MDEYTVFLRNLIERYDYDWFYYEKASDTYTIIILNQCCNLFSTYLFNDII